jgi:hypothetical protein
VTRVDEDDSAGRRGSRLARPFLQLVQRRAKGADHLRLSVHGSSSRRWRSVLLGKTRSYSERQPKEDVITE